MPDLEPAGSQSLFYVTYAPGNGFRWFGTGDIVIDDAIVGFSAQQRRPFWFSKSAQCEFPLDCIFNVERFDAIVRLEITDLGGEVRELQFQTVNSDVAESLAKRLPAPFGVITPADGAHESYLRAPKRANSADRSSGLM